jgi:hypothetical protein
VNAAPGRRPVSPPSQATPGDRRGNQVEAPPDRLHFGRKVEEAVQQAADRDLPDVHTGQGEGSTRDAIRAALDSGFSHIVLSPGAPYPAEAARWAADTFIAPVY